MPFFVVMLQKSESESHYECGQANRQHSPSPPEMPLPPRLRVFVLVNLKSLLAAALFLDHRGISFFLPKPFAGKVGENSGDDGYDKQHSEQNQGFLREHREHHERLVA